MLLAYAMARLDRQPSLDADQRKALGDDYVIGGDGHDVLFGYYGDDRLIGDFGEDLIFGDYGDDKIWAHDGDQDVIDCGPGNDSVNSADMTDGIANNCEYINRF
jgi:Ca2+-binding RTX toxin-like protein